MYKQKYINSKNLNTLYKNLQDDHSKILFENRLMYSITQNIKYIINENIEGNNYFKYIKSNIDSSVVVFTSDPHGEFICKTLLNIGIKIDAVYDASLASHNEKYYHGIRIVSFEELLAEYNDRFIFLANDFRLMQKEVYKLIDNGFSYNRIVQLKTPIQYFDFVKSNTSKKEIFIDGGSLYGDSIKDFIKWCNNYNKIYAFEPNKKCYAQLEKAIEHYNIKNILAYNKGLWCTKTKLNFSSGEFGDSEIKKSGKTRIRVDTIDNVVKNDPITFIKLNIEGAELEALKGAYNTIAKNKPVLAICLYHKPEDIVDIPIYILNNFNEYKLYIRKYSWFMNRLVLYCIP